MGTYLSFALLPSPTLLFVHCKTQNLFKRRMSEKTVMGERELIMKQEAENSTNQTQLEQSNSVGRDLQRPSSSTASPAVSLGTTRHSLQLDVCHFQTRQVAEAQTIKTRHPLTQQTAFKMHAWKTTAWPLLTLRSLGFFPTPMPLMSQNPQGHAVDLDLCMVQGEGLKANYKPTETPAWLCCTLFLPPTPPPQTLIYILRADSRNFREKGKTSSIPSYLRLARTSREEAERFRTSA